VREASGAPVDIFGEHHYPVQAAAAVAVVLVALVVAFTPGVAGRRFVAGTLALAAVVFGVESAIFPTKLASAGTVWG
jgi:hypothetical protein